VRHCATSATPGGTSIRVIPCGIGGGNAPDDPARFALLARHDAAPALWVDFVGYALWSFFDGVSTLHAACEAAARHPRLPVDVVRRRALSLLPALMRSGLAFLDGFPQRQEGQEGND